MNNILLLGKTSVGRMFARARSSSVKVVIGTSGGIGQTLGLLLTKNASTTKLALFNIVGTPGVAVDLSKINTPAKVTAHLLGASRGTENADIVIVPAGVPRNPGMARDEANAGIVRDIAGATAKTCPKAFLGIVTKRTIHSEASQSPNEAHVLARALTQALKYVNMIINLGSLVAVICVALLTAVFAAMFSVNDNFAIIKKELAKLQAEVQTEVPTKADVEDLKQLISKKWW